MAKESILSTIKGDAIEAAYRVAGTQITKATKNALLKVLQSRGINNRYINSASRFLDTEIGGAVVSATVGCILNSLPAFKEDKRAQTIAKEFRVSGMSLVGNLMADAVIGDLLGNFGSIIDRLPTLPNKVRIAPSLRIADITEEHETPAKFSLKGASK